LRHAFLRTRLSLRSQNPSDINRRHIPFDAHFLFDPLTVTLIGGAPYLMRVSYLIPQPLFDIRLHHRALGWI
jgi:hypothetical protein